MAKSKAKAADAAPVPQVEQATQGEQQSDPSVVPLETDPQAVLDELTKEPEPEPAADDAQYELVQTPEIPAFAGNKFEVDADVWSGWSETAQRVFNYLFWYMLQNQDLFKHPKAPLLEHEQWKTTAWNAAWVAANGVDGAKEEA